MPHIHMESGNPLQNPPSGFGSSFPAGPHTKHFSQQDLNVVAIYRAIKLQRVLTSEHKNTPTPERSQHHMETTSSLQKVSQDVLKRTGALPTRTPHLGVHQGDGCTGALNLQHPPRLPKSRSHTQVAPLGSAGNPTGQGRLLQRHLKWF